jgi:soluble lytic murein transglycosylase-like protein
MTGRTPYKIRALLCLLWCAAATPAFADRQRDPELGKLLKQALTEQTCFEDKFDQQVWHAAMEPQLQRVVKHPGERSDILYHVHCEARRLKLPPGLVMAVIDVESRGDPTGGATAPAGGGC